MFCLVIFTFYFVLQNFHFFVWLYKELLEPTFATCLAVLDNLGEVFGFLILYEQCLGFQKFILDKYLFLIVCDFLSYK